MSWPPHTDHHRILDILLVGCLFSAIFFFFFKYMAIIIFILINEKAFSLFCNRHFVYWLLFFLLFYVVPIGFVIGGEPVILLLDRVHENMNN